MDLMKVIKQKPYISAAVIIVVLGVVAVGIWYTTTQMSSNDTLSSSAPAPQSSSSGQVNTTPDVDCVVTYPSSWGPCSSSGVKSATGVVTTPQSGTGRACTPLTVTTSCTPQVVSAPNIDCAVMYPSSWGPCNDSTNMKSMTGTIITPQSGSGAPCGPLTKTAPCDKDCVVTYGAWGSCDNSSGIKSMTGTVTTSRSGTGAACGPLTMTGPCDVDCVVNWSGSVCNYNSGISTKQATVTTAQRNNGAPCGPLSMTGSCPKYLGVYMERNYPQHLIKSQGIMTGDQCYTAAKNANAKMFALGYITNDDGNAAAVPQAQCYFNQNDISTVITNPTTGSIVGPLKPSNLNAGALDLNNSNGISVVGADRWIYSNNNGFGVKAVYNIA